MIKLFYMLILFLLFPIVSAHLSDCQTQFCMQVKISNLTKKDQFANEIKEIVSLYQNGSISISNCHEILHVAGREAAKNIGLKASEIGTMECRGGYYHGAFEILGQNNSPAKLCPGIGNFPNKRQECLHGIGHGYAVYFDNATLALNKCSELSSKVDKELCASGIYMEIFEPGHELPLPLATENGSNICKNHNFSNVCYRYITMEFLDDSTNYSEAVNECKNLPNSSKICLNSIGHFISALDEYNATKAYFDCNNSSECIIGAASEFGQRKKLAVSSICKNLNFGSNVRCYFEYARGIFRFI